MEKLQIILIDGIFFAAWLFLISIGINLVFGVARILNMAHGSLYALGAYAGASLTLAYLRHKGWPYGSYFTLLLGAVLVGAIVGPVIERGLLRRIYGQDPNIQLLVTFALFLIIEDATKLIWGVNPYYVSTPFSLLGKIKIASLNYPTYSFLVLGLAIVTGLLLWLFINKTKFGRLLVAVIYDPEISTALGVNVSSAFTFAFALGTFLAALGGAFTAPTSVVLPGIGTDVIILAFAVVAIGGLGSLEGAALGALLVGIVRAATIHIIPLLELFTIYVVMALVLIFWPRGLLPPEEGRKI